VYFSPCATTQTVIWVKIKGSYEAELLKLLYDRFNARDMENVLTAMDEDVIWANGMEYGHVRGCEGVRSYWTRQWAMIDPLVEPIEFSVGSDGKSSSTSTKSCAISRETYLPIRWSVTFFRSRTGWSGSSIFEGRRRRRHTFAAQRVYGWRKAKPGARYHGRFACCISLAIVTFQIVPLTVWLEMRTSCLEGVVVPPASMRGEFFPQSTS